MKIAICKTITVQHPNYCQPQMASATRKGLDHQQQNPASRSARFLKVVSLRVALLQDPALRNLTGTSCPTITTSANEQPQPNQSTKQKTKIDITHTFFPISKTALSLFVSVCKNGIEM